MRQINVVLGVILFCALAIGQVNTSAPERSKKAAGPVGSQKNVGSAPDNPEPLICAAAPSQNAPPAKQPPTNPATAAELTDIARAALTAQNEVLVSGKTETAVKSSARAATYHEALRDSFAKMAERHDALAADHIAYKSFSTELSNSKLKLKGDTAILLVTEHTAIDMATDGGPTKTESVTDHRLTFTRDYDGWHLVSDELVNLPNPETPQPDELPAFATPTETAPPQQAEGKKRVDDSLALSSLNRTWIVSYAVKYWSNYNTAYRSFGNDCTNFASQAVYAGGWPMVTGFYTLSSAWWYDPTWPYPGQSYTWAGAHNFYLFTYYRPRASIAQNVRDLVPGDILQVDWNDANGNPVPDGHIDHTMIVTQKDAYGNIFLTYHSNSRLNKPFSDLLKEKPNAKWYGWRLYSYPS